MRKLLLLALLLPLLLAGCGKPTDLTQPPEIRFGRDVCAECGMSIDDARFAGGYYNKDGDPRLFDDLGDLLIYLRKHGDQPALVWVHDYESKTPIKASEATFVASSEVKGPHHGVVAFQSAEAAKAFAPHHAHILTWADLLEFDLAGAMDHNH